MISGTQKYPMMVPGPGHVDAEQELHASLLRQEEEGSESDVEINAFEKKQAANNMPKKVGWRKLNSQCVLFPNLRSAELSFFRFLCVLWK